MKRTLILAIISLALSACLVSGIPNLSEFSYYVAVVCNVFAWLGLLVGAVKGDVARRILENAYFNCVLTAIHLAALVYTGHPKLAASSLICTVFTLAAASATKEEPPCKT